MAKEADWAQRVADWRSSGLTAAEFCASHDYSAKTLWYWSSKLGRASRVNTSSVRLVRVARQRVAATPSASSIILEVAGAKLTLHGHVDEVALRTVVVTLRDLCLQDAQ